MIFGASTFANIITSGKICHEPFHRQKHTTDFTFRTSLQNVKCESVDHMFILFTTMPQVQQKTKEGHSVPAGTRHAGNHAWRYRPIFTSRGETWLCKTLLTYNIFPYLVSSMYCGLGPVVFYITAVYCVISSCRAFLKHIWKTKQKNK